MSELERMAGMLDAMASVLDDAPGIPGFKQITPEMVQEANRRAAQWLAEHPADEEPGGSSSTGGR